MQRELFVGLNILRNSFRLTFRERKSLEVELSRYLIEGSTTQNVHSTIEALQTNRILRSDPRPIDVKELHRQAMKLVEAIEVLNGAVVRG